MTVISWPELLVLLVVIVLIFGPGRLAKTMSELAQGIRSFRNSLTSNENTDSADDKNPNPK